MQIIFYIYQNNRCWQIKGRTKLDALIRWKENAGYFEEWDNLDSLKKAQGRPDKILVLTKQGKFIKV